MVGLAKQTISCFYRQLAEGLQILLSFLFASFRASSSNIEYNITVLTVTYMHSVVQRASHAIEFVAKLVFDTKCKRVEGKFFATVGKCFGAGRRQEPAPLTMQK